MARQDLLNAGDFLDSGQATTSEETLDISGGGTDESVDTTFDPSPSDFLPDSLYFGGVLRSDPRLAPHIPPLARTTPRPQGNDIYRIHVCEWMAAGLASTIHHTAGPQASKICKTKLQQNGARLHQKHINRNKSFVSMCVDTHFLFAGSPAG